MVAPDLVGRRILVVEDDLLIACLIEEALHGLGCIVVGPVSKLDHALRIAHEEKFDAAILDINIRGGTVFSVAECLRSRSIPFLLASGYGDWALPDTFRGLIRLTKPYTIQELELQVRILCQNSADV